MIYWFIGQAGAGKTSIAKEFVFELKCSGRNAIHFDGDDLRKLFENSYEKKTFTEEYRKEQTRILQRLISYIADQVENVIVSTVNPYREVREEFKKSRSDIMEIYVHTSDIRGREKFHAKDFEPPLCNYFDLDTTGKTVAQSVDKLLRLI